MGGLLGFGLGFSAISAVELCYFLCCRWCFRRKRKVSATNYNWATRNVVFSHPKRQSTTILVSPVNNVQPSTTTTNKMTFCINVTSFYRMEHSMSVLFPNEIDADTLCCSRRHTIGLRSVGYFMFIV